MTRGDFGTRLDLLTPADVSVTAARWLQTDGAEIELTAAELEDARGRVGGCDGRCWSLHDELAARGYTHEAIGEPGSGIRQICRDGVAVFRGRCVEVWAWLRTTDAE
jgi:hypothetical protein